MLGRVDFFLGQPSRVFYGLLDVVFFQIGKAIQDFLNSRSVGNLSDDYRNRNPHSANAGPIPHDVLVKCDSVKHRYLRGISACKIIAFQSDSGATQRSKLGLGKITL